MGTSHIEHTGASLIGTSKLNIYGFSSLPGSLSQINLPSLDLSGANHSDTSNGSAVAHSDHFAETLFLLLSSGGRLTFLIGVHVCQLPISFLLKISTFEKPQRVFSSCGTPNTSRLASLPVWIPGSVKSMSTRHFLCEESEN